MKHILSRLWLLMTTLIASTSLAEGNWPNYSQETGKFVNISPDRPLNMGFWDIIGVSYDVFLGASKRIPTVKLPDMKPDVQAFVTPSDKFKFVWFGHSTLMFNIDGKIILVDPVFSNNASPSRFITKRFQPAALKLEELPEVDAIVISHDHYDHLDEATIEHFRGKKTKFVVPLKVGEIIKDWDIPAEQIVELNWNESFDLDGVKLIATVAHHQSGRGLFSQGKTLWASWVFEGKAEKIYFSGDTAYTDHFAKIGETYGPFDYAFIENGQYDIKWPDSHMQPEESVQAAFDLKAMAMIPVHWGMFDIALHHWSEPVVRSSKIATDRGMRYLTPILGQLVDTSAMPAFTFWWEAVLAEEAQKAKGTP